MVRWYQVSGDARWARANVRSYASLDGDEEPQSCVVGGVPLDVVEIVDRWAQANHRYFKVKLQNRTFCVLRRDNGTKEWEMTAPTAHR
jgi:hypothetical protein